MPSEGTLLGPGAGPFGWGAWPDTLDFLGGESCGVAKKDY